MARFSSRLATWTLSLTPPRGRRAADPPRLGRLSPGVIEREPACPRIERTPASRAPGAWFNDARRAAAAWRCSCSFLRSSLSDHVQAHDGLRARGLLAYATLPPRAASGSPDRPPPRAAPLLLRGSATSVACSHREPASPRGHRCLAGDHLLRCFCSTHICSARSTAVATSVCRCRFLIGMVLWTLPLGASCCGPLWEPRLLPGRLRQRPRPFGFPAPPDGAPSRPHGLDVRPAAAPTTRPTWQGSDAAARPLSTRPYWPSRVVRGPC